MDLSVTSKIQPYSTPNSINTPKIKTVSFKSGDKVNFSTEKEEYKPFEKITEGIVKPVKDILLSVINNPLATGVTVGAGILTLSFLPPLASGAIITGVLGYSAGKIAVNSLNAVKNHKAGNDSEANENWLKVGEGAFDVGVTLLPAINMFKKAKATWQAASKVKNINNYQKMYALLNLIENPKVIRTTSSNINSLGSLWNAIKSNKVETEAAGTSTLKEGKTRKAKNIEEKPGIRQKTSKALNTAADYVEKNTGGQENQLTQSARNLATAIDTKAIDNELIKRTTVNRLFQILENKESRDQLIKEMISMAEKFFTNILERIKNTSKVQKTVATRDATEDASKEAPVE